MSSSNRDRDYRDRDRDKDRDRYRDRDYRDKDKDRDRDRDSKYKDDRDRDRDYRDRDRGLDRDRDSKYKDDRDRDRDYRDKDRDRNRDSSKYDDKKRDRSRSRSRSLDDRDRKDKKKKRSYSSDESDSDSDSYSSDESDSDRDRKSSSSKRSSKKESKDDRRKRKKEEKRLKEERKANETPEEKRARRLEKKRVKDEKRNGGSSSSSIDLSGYVNGDNPFNDSNLSGKFVWKAKREKLLKEGMSASEYDQKFSKKNTQEIQMELEKTKKRREDREREQQLWEEEKERLQRSKDMENNQELEKMEEEFHYNQACKRCETRLEDKRARPIDYLYKAVYIKKFENYSDLSDPVHLINCLSARLLEEVVQGIQEFIYLDPDHSQYWESCLEYANYTLSERLGVSADNGGLHHSLTSEIKNVLQGKTYKELVTLELGINQKLQSGSALNVEYWENLLQHLKIYKCTAYMRETFIERFKSRLEFKEHADKFIKEISNNPLFDDDDLNIETTTTTTNPQTTTTTTTTTNENGDIIQKEIFDLGKKIRQDEAIQGLKAKEEEKKSKMESEPQEDDEEQFNLEVQLEAKHYSWNDKYRPRKPKYFNRVHSGYDWSKYNQTHYDSDNPPPKIVKGYKFNIFYPDLIDSSKSPRFFIEESKDNPDTCILRFTAGPPYEDIAFKIVKKEWDQSHKHGYKCVFDKGVLHLWFSFKRYRYRR